MGTCGLAALQASEEPFHVTPSTPMLPSQNKQIVDSQGTESVVQTI